MSADPMIQAPFSQGLNRFAYAFNSPLNYTDPTGYEAGQDEAKVAAFGVFTGYVTGLAVHLLTKGPEAGAVVAGTSSAGAGTPALAAAGPAAGIATSIAINVILSGRQPTSAIINAPPSTRTATAAGTGQTPLGRSSYASMATSPVQERPAGMSLLAPEREALAMGPACRMNPAACAQMAADAVATLIETSAGAAEAATVAVAEEAALGPGGEQPRFSSTCS